MLKAIDEDHEDLKKRQTLDSNCQIKPNKKPKRQNKNESTDYQNHSNHRIITGDDVNFGLDMVVGNNKIEMSSANFYLDSLVVKIVQKLMHVGTKKCNLKKTISKSESNNTVVSVNIIFTANKGRKIVFTKKSLQIDLSNKNTIIKEDFEVFLLDKFDDVRSKIAKAVYVYYSDFVDDIHKAINQLFHFFHIQYQTEFFKDYYRIILDGVSEYKYRKNQDIMVLYSHWPELRINTDNFLKYPLQTRKYYKIDSYKSALDENKDENVGGMYDVENLLKSEVKPHCEAECCCLKEVRRFCKISHYRDHWESGCCDKKSNIECGENCGCDSSCNNRALQTSNMGDLSKNVEIKLCWGVDLATRQSICFLMPVYLNFEGQRYYTDKILNNLNNFGYEGWNLTNCLEYLVSKVSSELQQHKMNSLEASFIDFGVANIKSNTFLNSEMSNTTCDSNEKSNQANAKDDVIAQISKFLGKNYDEDTLVTRIKSIERDSIKSESNYSKTIKNLIECQNINPYANHIEKMSRLEQLEQELEVYTVLLKHTKVSQVRAALRVHTKGLGVVCNKQQGIEKNSLVVPYIGEVYPIWYWCMKQDVIKSFCSSLKKDKLKKFSEYKNNYNMDFYNIMLEKSIKEPQGKDIVVIDPIIRGNFGSRLSHSCNPNCMAFPVISNGQYSIVMYAIRDISYQEELTFDYCSVTESEQEYKNSICLCGTLHCKGYYLGFTKKHVEVFTGDAKKHLIDGASNSFLQANANILKACESSFTVEKSVELMKFYIGENTFKESPEWLKNWSYYVLQTIKNEKIGLIKDYMGIQILDDGTDVSLDIKLDEKQTSAKFEIDTLFSQRINNLVISIDKLRHFLNRQTEELKNTIPLRLLTVDEHIEYITLQMSQILNLEIIHTDEDWAKTIIEYINNKDYSNGLLSSNIKTNFENPKVLRLVRGKLILLGISHFLKKKHTSQMLGEAAKGFDSKTETFEGLSDILYLMAFTVACFTSSSFDGFTMKIDIRECDLTSTKRTFILNTKPDEQQLEELMMPITSLDK